MILVYKLLYLKNILILVSGLLLIDTLYAQEDYEKWLKDQQAALEEMELEEATYMETVTAEFDDYASEQERQFQDFKTAVEKKWDEFRYSSKKTYTDYDQDLNARSSIDFESGEVEIEVLVEDDPDQTRDEKELAGTTKLQQKLTLVVTKEADDNQAILKDQLKTKAGKKVTKGNAAGFSKEVVTGQPVKVANISSKDGQKRIKYSVKIRMLPDHLKTRASRFRAEVQKQSKRFEIDPAVVFAVMHVESSFNPKARSHIPAFGLMQLVPKSGARDAYNYIYKHDRLLKDSYLYVPANNIELGCAYLSKIRYDYFNEIENDESAYYCTISAYNTGPSNVAKTFTGETRLKPTAKIVNGKSSQDVYNHLRKGLPYKETRDYLIKVVDRIDYYETWR